MEDMKLPEAIDQGEEAKLVPVVEAIKYRKRAQNAEKEVAQLQDQLSSFEKQNESLKNQMSTIEAEKDISQRLSCAGVIDIETATLLVKSRLKDDGDVESAIEKLKQEKEYLFEVDGSEGLRIAAVKTAGVKNRAVGNASVFKIANQAAKSGSRVDLMEYMKARREKI